MFEDLVFLLPNVVKIEGMGCYATAAQIAGARL